MDDRSFRLGDHCRYPFKKESRSVDWSKTINDYLEGHSAVGYLPHRPRPAKQKTIDHVQMKLGIELPLDVREAYLCHNGFGFKGPNTLNGKDWSLVPIKQIAKFSKAARMWFAETHKEESKRFIAIVPNDDGSSLGYLIDRKGKLVPELCGFELSSCDYDEDQEIEEFVVPQFDSFTDFILNQIPG